MESNNNLNKLLQTDFIKYVESDIDCMLSSVDSKELLEYIQSLETTSVGWITRLVSPMTCIPIKADVYKITDESSIVHHKESDYITVYQNNRVYSDFELCYEYCVKLTKRNIEAVKENIQALQNKLQKYDNALRELHKIKLENDGN